MQIMDAKVFKAALLEGLNRVFTMDCADIYAWGWDSMGSPTWGASGNSVTAKIIGFCDVCDRRVYEGSGPTEAIGWACGHSGCRGVIKAIEERG